MYKNFALLSIGATAVISLFFCGVGYAFQIDLKKQAELNQKSNLAITQVSTTPIPCGGRNISACKHSSSR
jgi:shikimate kinase